MTVEIQLKLDEEELNNVLLALDIHAERLTAAGRLCVTSRIRDELHDQFYSGIAFEVETERKRGEYLADQRTMSAADFTDKWYPAPVFMIPSGKE